MSQEQITIPGRAQGYELIINKTWSCVLERETQSTFQISIQKMSFPVFVNKFLQPLTNNNLIFTEP